MNILVTGGAGYIGSHTCLELLQAGYQVTALVRATSDVSALKPLDVRLVEGDVNFNTSGAASR